jgi:hypothetical protein
MDQVTVEQDLVIWRLVQRNPAIWTILESLALHIGVIYSTDQVTVERDLAIWRLVQRNPVIRTILSHWPFTHELFILWIR